MLALSLDEGSTPGPLALDPYCQRFGIISYSICYRPTVITYPFKSAAAGFGGRFGYALTDHIGLESEVNYYPSLTEAQLNRHALEVRAGVRAGWRGSKLGIFGKVRPGFLWFESDAEDCDETPPLPPPCTTTKFGADFGGIVELYMPRSMFIRFDVGDMFIYRDPDRSEDTFHHNLEASAGIGFRF
jgi:hypothetical protein